MLSSGRKRSRAAKALLEVLGAPANLAARANPTARANPPLRRKLPRRKTPATLGAVGTDTLPFPRWVAKSGRTGPRHGSSLERTPSLPPSKRKRSRTCRSGCRSRRRSAWAEPGIHVGHGPRKWTSHRLCLEDSDDNPCNACVKKECCTETQALYLDPLFDELFSCITTCSTEDCALQCGVDYPTVAQKSLTWSECRTAHCESECENP